MAAHVCPDCGMMHDAPVQQESEAVAIARIQADNALAIAKLEARADTHAVDIAAEAAQEIAETDAEAMVESAAVEAEVVAAAVEAGIEPEPDEPPIVIEAPADEEPADAQELPPADGSPIPSPAASRRGLGMW